MHPFDIRESRFRLQKQIAQLEEGTSDPALEAQVAALQQACEHANFDEDPAKGWRCRDCDLSREPDKQDEPEATDAAAEPAAA